ncbi:MAG: efflux RND transporter permease subunit, partial [Pseudomonadota bacterium]
MGTLFFRNPRIVALTILMILAIGISALYSVGRQEDPAISNIFATIVTPYPGADPARVESLVTEKVEDELKKIAETREIASTSRSGISVVTVELAWNLSEEGIEQIWSEVRDAISDAKENFPAGAGEPSFDNDRTGAFSVISALVARPGAGASDAVMRRYAEILQDRLRDLGGTKIVNLYGDRDEEILVTVDRRALASLGLTATQVADAIAGADTKVRAGQIRGAADDLLIEVEGEIKSLDRIRSVPVADGPDGGIVRVSDVATVGRALREPATSLAYANGTPAVLIAAKVEEQEQVDVWMDRVRAIMAEFETELPAGLEHRLLFDQSDYTTDRLSFVLGNMLIGAGLVLGVLLLTLGWRAALIVASILPLASLLSLGGFQALGIPINQMSITGLIVALGLLVDAGIVMTDEIRKRLEAGAERDRAVGASVRRLAAPLLASTVTTALAFTPMALLPGPAGDFVGSIAIAVIIMLVSSFGLAMTVTPALSGWILKRPSADASSRPGILTAGFRSDALASVFQRSLLLSLNFPKIAILGALVLPVIGFGAMPTLKAQFFPGVDRDQFYVQVKLPTGTAIAETDRTVQDAEAVLRGFDGVRSVHWVIGESAPAFYYNMTADQDAESSFAEALVTTESPDATESILPDLQRALDRRLPDARIIVRGLVQGPPVDAPVEIRVVGPDIQVLREIGDEVRRVMASVPDILQARTQLGGGAPKVVLDLDEEAARLAGLDLGTIAGQLEASLEGALGGSLVESSEELPVRVRYGEAGRRSVDVLRGTDVLATAIAQEEAARGAFPGVPLAALGTVRIVPAESPVYRRNGERINTIQGYSHRTVLPEQALKKVQDRIADSGMTLPPGYRFEVGGDSDARNDVLNELLAAAGMIIALSVATIVLTFNSFRLSLIAGTVAMLSMGLSLLALALFDYPL